MTPKTIMRAVERKSLDSKDKLALLEKGMYRIGVPIPNYAKPEVIEGEKKKEDPLSVLARYEKEKDLAERAAHRRVFSEETA